MEQEEIRKRANAAQQEIVEARGAVEVAIAKMRVVYALCNHPDQYQVSHMGETGYYCPDCQRST